MKLLVTGCNGQLGWELVRALQPLGEVVGVDRSTFDLGDTDGLRERLRAIRPDVVANAAAYTAVDKAESDEAAATAVNSNAPGVIAEECRRLGALLLHFSTDYVFDGTGTRAWREDDPPNPLNAYGRSKLAGERAIAAATDDYLVLRTSWVYSLRGANFLKTIVRLANSRDRLQIVADQVGAPTPAGWLADASAHLLARRLGCERFAGASGIVHVSCAGHTSWHGFAVAIVDALSRDGVRNPALRIARTPPIDPIATADFPTPARRPANSRLDLSRLRDVWEIAAPDWRDALALVARDA